MREALGQPLSEVSSTVLNKMVSKEVALDLRKYKKNPTGAKTPSKRPKSRTATQEDETVVVKFEN